MQNIIPVKVNVKCYSLNNYHLCSKNGDHISQMHIPGLEMYFECIISIDISM